MHTVSASEPLAADWFAIAPVREKIAGLPRALDGAFGLTRARRAFDLGRDVQVVTPSALPSKPGLSLAEGQARLLHDLASIELQAMELAVRTLNEYPEASPDFRKELADIALGEARHLGLCLDGIEALGYQWGHWPVHNALWNVVGPEDTLLDRILIVHRHLEGSGLDAGESMLRRLTGATKIGPVREIVGLIVHEEVDHVLFGTKWYRKTAESLRIDPEKDFVSRIAEISALAPRREKIAHDARRRAGFTEAELEALERCFPAGPNRGAALRSS